MLVSASGNDQHQVYSRQRAERVFWGAQALHTQLDMEVSFSTSRSSLHLLSEMAGLPDGCSAGKFRVPPNSLQCVLCDAEYSISLV